MWLELPKHKHDDTVKSTFGIAVWGWWAIGGVLFLFSLLQSFKNATQFNSTIVFILALIVSIMLLSILPKKFHHGLHEKLQEKDQDGLNVFWLENPTLHELIVWLPTGFGLVVVSSYIGSIINNPLAGIIGSGIILSITLFQTRSILTPMIIHGMFNTFVLLAQSGFFGNNILGLSLVKLAATPSFQIPIIGVSVGNLSPFISEVLFQNFLVAPGEECFKLLIIAMVVVFIKSYFTEDTGIKWVAAFFAAVPIWAYLHLLNAL